MTTKKRIQIFITSILLIIALGIGMYVYFTTLSDDGLDLLTNSEENKENEAKFNEKEIIDFIETYNLEQFERMTTSFDEIDNQFKLVLAFNYLIQNDANDFEIGVSAALFDGYLKTVFGRSTDIEHEQIISKNITYNEKDNTYTGKISKPDMPKVVLNRKNESRVNNDEYIITFSKAYSWDERDVFGNLPDALNRQNVIFTGKADNNFEENYYSELKTKIKRIKYTFTLENNRKVLKNVEILD